MSVTVMSMSDAIVVCVPVHACVCKRCGVRRVGMSVTLVSKSDSIVVCTCVSVCDKHV